MKTPKKLNGKSSALIVGRDVFDCYLKTIDWNLRTMMGQADILETAIMELTKQQREYRLSEQA